MSKDLNDLIGRHLDGVASPEDMADLDERLRGDPQAARRFAILVRLDAQLADHCRDRADVSKMLSVLERAEASLHTPRLDGATQGRSARTRRGAIAAASLLIAATAAVCYWQLIGPAGAGRPFSRVVSGEVLVNGSPADRIPAGARLEVRGTADALVRLSDGSQATLAPSSVVILHGPSGRLRQLVELSRGGGTFRVEKAAGTFEVRTPLGRVTVPGTEFSIRLIPERAISEGPTRKGQHTLLAVAVLSGIVQVELGGKTYRLTGGEERLFAAEAADTVDLRQRAEALIASAREHLEAANVADAAEAYAKALEVFPGGAIQDAAGKDPWARVRARKTRADLWGRMRRFDEARQELRARFGYPARDMLELRSWIHELIGDSFAAEENWAEAEKAFQAAVRTGLDGDARDRVPPKLEKAKRLAREPGREKPDAERQRAP